MINCDYCNIKMEENTDFCPRCGAPNNHVPLFVCARQESERCTCGLPLGTNIQFYKIKNIICGGCAQLFDGAFYARYDCDRMYANGQITHLFFTSGLECSHCGKILPAHEFYHGLYDNGENGESLIEHFKNAHRKGNHV